MENLLTSYSTVCKWYCQQNVFNKKFVQSSQKSLKAVLLQSCIKQFSRTVFWDSSALRLPYNCITVDALRELGIIPFAWHFRTSCSNTPFSKGICGCPTSFLMCRGLKLHLKPRMEWFTR